jgi:trehalose 6-phosphate phosphatase
MTHELKHLFGEEGGLALNVALRARPLLAFDFDGTLAPIVARPDDAYVAVEVSQRLERLARIRPLAIVTGRSVEDVTRRLGFTARFIVGNHGAEEAGRPPVFETAAMDVVRARLDARAGELLAAGIQVEDKGYSLALHYRLAPDRRMAATRIEAILADLDPMLRCFPGKCVFNVVAADAPDKYDAILSLVRRAGCGLAVFVGDDVNDDAVFVRSQPNWLTVRVGRDDPESCAAFFLDCHAEVSVLLEKMLHVLEAG